MNQQGDYYLESFNYTAPIANLLGVIGNAITVTLNITNDADFQCKKVTIAVTQALLLVANWGGTFQINDSGPGRTLFNDPIPVDAMRGNGELPYYYEPPRLFLRNSSVQITFTNNVATVTTAQIVFHGAKLRPAGWTGAR